MKLFLLISIFLGFLMNHNVFAAGQLQYYPKVTEASHPAVANALAFLDAQVNKDYAAFAACFDADAPIFVNLPGGVIMRDVRQLLERHKKFYKNPAFHVSYEALKDGVGNNDFFTCSVFVHVVLPDGTKRNNYIDMTFFKNNGNGPAWIPIRLVNTELK